MIERGVQVDHAALNRRVVKYSPDSAKKAQQRKQPTADSWRITKTDIKVNGKWMYWYRAVGPGNVPDRIAIDKSDVNLADLQSLNVVLKFTGTVGTSGWLLGAKCFEKRCKSFVGRSAEIDPHTHRL